MGSLYVKGSKVCARYKNEQGRWKGAPTPYRPGDEAKARRFLKGLEAESQAKGDFARRSGDRRKGPITVADYATRWVTDQQQLGLVSAGDDANRLKRHACRWSGRWQSKTSGRAISKGYVAVIKCHDDGG
jgi:hypothetical protein